MLKELISLLDQFQSNDETFLDKYRLIGRDIINNPDRIRKIISICKSFSPNANSLDKGSRNLQIVEEIENLFGDNTFTRRELLTGMQRKEQSNQISYGQLGKILTRLIASKDLAFDLNGHVKVFRINKLSQ